MNHKEYWARRISETTRNLFDMTNDKIQEQLKPIYIDLADYMTSEVETIWFKLLEDDITRTDIWTYKRYRDLSKRMAVMAAKVGVKEEAILNTQLEIALKEIYKTTPLPNITIATSFTMMNETAVKQLLATPWSEKHYSQAVWDNKAKMLSILKDGLTKSIVLGESKDKTVVKLRDLIIEEKGKSLHGAFADADRLVRTELQHILTSGQCQRYIDNGFEEGEIVTADDERTCEKCASLDGTIFSLTENPLPIHARCRCDLIPKVNWGH